MSGGLVFGAPAWIPQRIESTFDDGSGGAGPAEAAVAPVERRGLLEALQRANVGRTCAIVPPLVDQVRGLGAIQRLVLCLVPTQPEFALPAALSRLAAEDLHAGLTALRTALAPRTSVVVIDRHDLATRRAVRRILKRDNVRMVTVLNRYPEAHPTVLLRRLFGIRLEANALPTTVETVLADPVGCWALGRYLRTGRGLIDRPVQIFVQGSREHAAHLVMGRIGETLRALCGRFGIRIEGMQVIVNGMLAGREVAPETATVNSSTESVGLRERPAIDEPSACLACGWCVDVCPTGLTPVRLMELAERVPAARSWREARESLHCIGCGLCSYVCPSRLPLASETLRLRNWVSEQNEPRPETQGEGRE